MSTKTLSAASAGGDPVAPHVVLPRPGAARREAQYLRRADALAAEGKVEKALVHLRKLVAFSPECTRGYLRLASLLRQEHRADEALAVLRNAVTHAPRCVASREALAETCLESGQWQEAIRHSHALLALCPRSLFARDVLSAAYLQCGRLDAALTVTEEMIRIDPLDATNHFKRGVLLQQKGIVGGAICAFVRVLEMDADPEVADESRSALELLDGYQIRQILTLAVEDVPFRLRLRRDPAEAVSERGYFLSPLGLGALSQVCFDDLPEPPAGWRHYRYH